MLEVTKELVVFKEAELQRLEKLTFKVLNEQCKNLGKTGKRKKEDCVHILLHDACNLAAPYANQATALVAFTKSFVAPRHQKTGGSKDRVC